MIFWKMASETVNVTVNTFASETVSFESTGSGLESDTVNFKVNTIVSETSRFDLMGRGLQSEPLNLKVNTIASETSRFDLMGSGLESVNVHLKVNTRLLGKVVHECRTHDLASGRSGFREVVSVGRDYWSQQDSPRLGLRALVLDTAPCDASAMSEGLLATLIQEDDTASEEPAA